MFETISGVARLHGVVPATQYACYRMLQQLAIVDVTQLMIQSTDEIAGNVARANTQFRFLEPQEVRAFAQDPTNDLDANLADRLSSGYDHCFGAVCDGQLACYSWFALHSIEARNNSTSGSARSGVSISYPEEYAFRYKGYTHPDYRGRRLYSQTAQVAAAALRDLGVHHVLSTAEWVNFSALRSSYRSGFRDLGRIFLAEIFGKRILRCPDLSEDGIYFDEDASVYDRDQPPSQQQPQQNAVFASV